MPTSMSGSRHRACSFTEEAASAMSAMIPPSPRLSARMMSTTYLSDTTIISAQNMVDRPPRMFGAVSAMPWTGAKVSLTAYSGLVPMSPKTMPSAASVRAAVEDFAERWERSKGAERYPRTAQNANSALVRNQASFQAQLQRLAGD